MARRLRGLAGQSWALPALVLAFSQWEAWIGGPSNLVGPLWAVAASGAAGSVALLWRRRAPLLAQLVAAAVTTAPWLVWGASETATSALLGVLTTFAVGRFGRRPAAYVGLPVVALWTIAQLALDPLQDGVADGWGWAVWGLASWAAGAWLRQRAELQSRSAAGRLAAQRAELAEERLRLSRELHDVLANSLGVMVVHAEAAEELLSADPDRATLAIRRVQSTGREALGEVRALLGVLRAERDGGDSLLPSWTEARRGVGQMEALVEEFRAVGLPVTFDSRVGREVPAAVGATVYRLFQEALTNALRHAGPVPTRAELVISADQVRAEVSNPSPPGVARAGGSAAAPGIGIAGMRERVQALGGTVDARALADGGFLVQAVIPLAPLLSSLAVPGTPTAAAANPAAHLRTWRAARRLTRLPR
ncbi:MAG TPA: histidine kinase [Dermatophilaceae bacterium]|nr:histidine kinase [Dermatophilaceae bacterium]